PGGAAAAAAPESGRRAAGVSCIDLRQQPKERRTRLHRAAGGNGGLVRRARRLRRAGAARAARAARAGNRIRPTTAKEATPMNEAAPLTVLIYYQNEKRAEEVRSLVARRFPQLTVRAVSARGDAEALVEEADVIAGWGFPTDLLARARRLRWFHKFAAGVDDVVAAVTLPPQA